LTVLDPLAFEIAGLRANFHQTRLLSKSISGKYDNNVYGRHDDVYQFSDLTIYEDPFGK
jgi:hypothetical protein